MACYSIEPRTRKCVKGYGFLSFRRNLSKTCRKQLLDAATKTGVDAIKSATQKVAHKGAEAIGESIANEILLKL